jgi:hypothetical protein
MNGKNLKSRNNIIAIPWCYCSVQIRHQHSLHFREGFSYAAMSGTNVVIVKNYFPLVFVFDWFNHTIFMIPR